MAVLSMGGAESNPLVSYLMSLGPFRGLVLAKSLVIALAAAGSAMHRGWALGVANLVFSGVVAWNCSIIARLAF